MKPKLICFDLEGPLSPQDNAYDVVSLIPGGRELFEMISRYDDIMTVEGRRGYEPGDTLALIAPFLIYHNITSKDIKRVSSRAKIVDGAGELVSYLKEDDWKVRIISTSYKEHAYNIGSQIGVSPEEIACTGLDLEKIAYEIGEKELTLIADLESKIADKSDDVGAVMNLLNSFFFKVLPDTRYGNPLARVRVVGGSRKVDAAKEFAKSLDLNLGDIMVVGDSITDFKMLSAVREEGGVAVAFNANMYALPHANFSLATLDMRFLDLLCREFPDKDKMVEVAKSWQNSREDFEEDLLEIPDDLRTPLIDDLLENFSGSDGEDFIVPHIHYLVEGGDALLKEVATIHARFREQVRGRASILG